MIILLSGLRPITTIIPGSSNSHGSSDRLKLFFSLIFKALKTKVGNFSVVGVFVLANYCNNKETLKIGGCRWYFGGKSSSLKAEYFGRLLAIHAWQPRFPFKKE